MLLCYACHLQLLPNPNCKRLLTMTFLFVIYTQIKYLLASLCLQNRHKKYILSKFLCSVIISFALVIICYLAFAAVCFSVFPYPEEYAEGIFYRAWYNYYGINKILSSDSYLIFIFGRICTASIIGTVGGLFCLILSSMTMSKYVSLGIPVLVYFFLCTSCKAL